MGKKALTDPVYRAAILAARDIDSGSDTTRASASVAMAATLERHGVRLKDVVMKPTGKPVPGLLELDGGEGVVVSVADEERSTDWAAVSRQNRWRRVHLVHFAPRAISIKTMAV